MSDAAPTTTTNEPRTGVLGANYLKLFGAGTISNLGDGIAMIAYPWLASAVTRDPFLIALVAVVQRLPWLVFSLPAGVVTDRVDRRTIIVRANVVRAVITLAVAMTVLARQDALPGPSEIADGSVVITTDAALYLVILVATALLGIAEVFADNAGQTFMPSIVHADDLEKANGRLWSSELIANTFVGPPLGALLIAVAFSLPFIVDAGTFAVAAALVSLIPATVRRTDLSQIERKPWRDELAEGFRWLWGHDFLKWLAIILGMVNALGAMTFAVLVLFAQEVLGTSATEFAILNTGGALGGIVGGWTASAISKRIGPGPSLYTVLISGTFTTALIGVIAWWPFTWLMMAITMFFGVIWNVITVSLRQTIIPDHLLGRVNSVYRFFGWGMMPLGAIIGGVVVAIADSFGDRDLALRMPWFVAGALYFGLFVFAAPKLTTARIERARAEGIAAKATPRDAADQGSS